VPLADQTLQEQLVEAEAPDQLLLLFVVLRLRQEAPGGLQAPALIAPEVAVLVVEAFTTMAEMAEPPVA
jgi:hypothetical protein